MVDNGKVELNYYDFPPPNGCEYANGELVVGSILETRDGRHTGNAIILERTVNDDLDYVFTVETDFGNRIVLTEHEIGSLFHPPRFKSEISRWEKDRAEKQTKKSCYDCMNFMLCFLRRRIWDCLCGVEIISENTHAEVFKSIGNGCNQYSPREDGD